MLLGSVTIQVNDTIQYAVDYRRWLLEGEILTFVATDIDSGSAIISNISLSPDQKSVSFQIGNGSLGDQFNVIVTANTSLGQIRNDQIAVFVETDGGPVFSAGVAGSVFGDRDPYRAGIGSE